METKNINKARFNDDDDYNQICSFKVISSNNSNTQWNVIALVRLTRIEFSREEPKPKREKVRWKRMKEKNVKRFLLLIFIRVNH